MMYFTSAIHTTTDDGIRGAQNYNTHKYKVRIKGKVEQSRE